MIAILAAVTGLSITGIPDGVYLHEVLGPHC